MGGAGGWLDMGGIAGVRIVVTPADVPSGRGKVRLTTPTPPVAEMVVGATGRTLKLDPSAMAHTLTIVVDDKAATISGTVTKGLFIKLHITVTFTFKAVPATGCASTGSGTASSSSRAPIAGTAWPAMRCARMPPVSSGASSTRC